MPELQIDEEARIQSFSTTAVRRFGYEPDEVVGRNVISEDWFAAVTTALTRLGST